MLRLRGCRAHDVVLRHKATEVVLAQVGRRVVVNLDRAGSCAVCAAARPSSQSGRRGSMCWPGVRGARCGGVQGVSLSRVFMKVVLPQPDGPMSATSDWGGTTPLTPSRMVVPLLSLSVSPMFSKETLAGLTRFCDASESLRKSDAKSSLMSSCAT